MTHTKYIILKKFLCAIILFILISEVDFIYASDFENTNRKGLYSKLGQEDPDNINEKSRSFYLGISAGFPYFFGLKSEYFLKRSKDLMPAYLVSNDLGVSVGPGFGLVRASVLLEKRLGYSSFYVGCGYNYTAIAGSVSTSNGGIYGGFGVHSFIFSLTTRSSYLKHASVSASLGLLINPSISDELPVFPSLTISLIRAN